MTDFSNLYGGSDNPFQDPPPPRPVSTAPANSWGDEIAGSVGDLLTTFPRGQLAAAEDFSQSIYKLFGGTPWDDVIPHGKSAVGRLSEGAMQWGLGFVLPGGAVAGAATKVGLLANAGRVASLGKNLLASSVADFTAFQGNEERLSNILSEYAPEAAKPVLDWLGSNEEDSDLEGRAKSVIEGLALGAMTDAVLYGMRKLRAGKHLADGTPVEVREDANRVLAGEIDASQARDPAATTEAIRKLGEIENMEGRPDMDAIAQKYGEELRALINDANPPHETTNPAMLDEAGQQVFWKKTEEGTRVATYNGVTRELKRTKIDGYKEPQWVDAVTGEHMGDRLSTATAKTFDLALPGGERSERLTPERAVEIANAINERVLRGGNAIAPYKMDIAHLIAEELDARGITLQHMDETGAAVVRGLEDTLDSVFSKLNDPQTLEQMRAEGMDWLKDHGADDLQLQAMAEGTSKDFVRMTTAVRIKMAVATKETEKALQKMQSSWGTEAEELAKDQLTRALYTQGLAQRAVQPMKSSAGRALRSWGDSYAELYRTWEQMARNPNTRVQAMKVVDKLRAATGNSAAFNKLVRSMSGSRVIPMLMEFWVNSILGHARTWAVQFTSVGNIAMVRPFEKMIGGAFHALTGEGKFGRAMIHSAGADYVRMVRYFTKAVKTGGMSLLKNTDLLLGEARATETLSGMAQQRAITGENVVNLWNDTAGAAGKATRSSTLAKWFSVNPDKGFGRMLSTVGTAAGELIRIPTRVITGIDGFTKAWQYHVHAEHMFTMAKIQEGMSWSDASKAAKEMMDGITEGHQALSRKVLLAKAFDELEGAGLSHGDRLRAAQEIAYERWNEDVSALEKMVIGDSSENARRSAFQQVLTKDRGGFEGLTARYGEAMQAVPLLRAITPFLSTPYNIFRWGKDRTLDPAVAMARKILGQTDFSALPSVNEIRNRFYRDFNALGAATTAEERLVGLQRQSEAVGRVASGMGLLATGLWLTQSREPGKGGWITGAGPKNKEERRLLEATGWQPYSIDFTDFGLGFMSYHRLDPVATVLGSMADFADYLRYADTSDQDTVETMAAALGVSFAENFTNKTYLQGIRNLVDAFSDPAGVGPGLMRQYAAALVPNYVQDSLEFWQGRDPLMRETYNFLDKARAKLPGLGSELEPVRNFMGEPLHRISALGAKNAEKFGGRQFGTMVDLIVPIAYNEVADSLVYKELAQLKHPFTPPRPMMSGLDLRDAKHPETGQSAFDRMLELRGTVERGGYTLKTALREVLRSEQYQRMPVESTPEVQSPRITAIKRVIDKFHRAARRQMLMEYPDLAEKLSEIQYRKAASSTGSTLESLGR